MNEVSMCDEYDSLGLCGLGSFFVNCGGGMF